MTTDATPEAGRKHQPPGYLKEGFTRYILDVAYKGTNYHGFQLQPNAPTVQGEIERALEMLLRTHLETYSAGRTDAGVHGLHMPTQFDFQGELPAKFLVAINGILPKDIAVNRVWTAARPDFNVRFAATGRAYIYRICRIKSPFDFDFAWHYRKRIDLDAMKRGAEIIMEYDSFETFCKAGGSNKTFFCRITDSHWEEKGNVLEYHVSADRFLRGMVRAIVGTLLEMGKGSLTEAGLRQALEARSRAAAGTSLPPEGLTLTDVTYRSGELIPYDLPLEIDFKSLH